MKKDVMIGFPVYDHRAEISIVQEIYACMHDPNNPVSILQYYNGDSLIPRARNKIAQMFLDSTNDYLMFIDSDIRFRKDHIARPVALTSLLWVACTSKRSCRTSL